MMNAAPPKSQAQSHSRRHWLMILFVFTAHLGGMLACQGNVENMTIGGVPKYVCPSSTPKSTDIMPPPSSPNYPAAFQVNLNHSTIHSTRNVINVQYLAQNVGTVMLTWQYTNRATGIIYTNPTPLTLASTGNFAGVQSSYPLYLPASSTISSAQITVWSSSGTYTYPISSYTISINPETPLVPPCCLPPPIIPTDRPTYTPYPTPTKFEILPPLSFYLEDPIYNRTPPVELRLRMKSPILEHTEEIFWILEFTGASWQIEIKNVGQVEYDFLGAGYTYVSEVETSTGTIKDGVWSPSHFAATFLGITESAYNPVALLPGETITVRVAAMIPGGSKVRKIALLLNPYLTGDPGWATFTPESGKDKYIIHWQNAPNTVCSGEIAYP
jgi:hypothetical protein